MKIEALAESIREKRGRKGVLEAAKDIGISPATLSRIENEKIPDLETFEKVCTWLKHDPITYLEAPSATKQPKIQVHFKKETAINQASAQALTQMILHAYNALIEEENV
jgi:transcriptional regulator with XRE-family HTH domain